MLAELAVVERVSVKRDSVSQALHDCIKEARVALVVQAKGHSLCGQFVAPNKKIVDL